MQGFGTGITLRTLLIVLLALATAWSAWHAYWLLVVLTGGALAWSAWSLHHYATGINRKLARFFDAVQYSDFVSTFRADDTLGSSFQAVNTRLNEVLDAFRQARAEREASLQYLQTVVQQLNVGLIVCDHEGKVELTNQASLRLLGTYRLRVVSDLDRTLPDLAQLLRDPYKRSSCLIQLPDDQELACQATAIRLRGRLLHIATFQNIRSELQQKEIEAWQNLTRVLRHEIMNSVTPLVTLVGTMKAIVEEDLPDPARVPGAIVDLRTALDVVESRGRGILRFVDAYRSFSALPPPRLGNLAFEPWLQRVVALVQPDLTERKVVLKVEKTEETSDLTLRADGDQLEMVLINLLKNASEALAGQPVREISIRAQSTPNGSVVLEISDNGPGISPDYLPHIFIPFFTTKPDGNGIGLSLSRQIVTAHGGMLSIASDAGKGVTARIELPA